MGGVDSGLGADSVIALVPCDCAHTSVSFELCATLSSMPGLACAGTGRVDTLGVNCRPAFLGSRVPAGFIDRDVTAGHAPAADCLVDKRLKEEREEEEDIGKEERNGEEEEEDAEDAATR